MNTTNCNLSHSNVACSHNTHIILRILAGMSLFIMILSCSRNSENVTTGRGLDPSTHKPREVSDTFAAGEPFSLVLAPVRLRDSYLDMTVSAWGTNSQPKKVRTLTLKGLDTREDYLQISNAFSIPFPGRYRISFAQLGNVLGWADVTITPTAEAPEADARRN